MATGIFVGGKLRIGALATGVSNTCVTRALLYRMGDEILLKCVAINPPTRITNKNNA